MIGGSLLVAVPFPAGAEIEVKRDSRGSIIATNATHGGYARRQEAMIGTSAEPRAERPAGGGTELDALIDQVARDEGLSTDLVRAVVSVESGFDPRAVSPKGARGLMQLMPGTARELGVADVYDPRENLTGGARHLRRLLEVHDGDLELALASYNAGLEAVRKHGGIPPYKETRDYVRRITALLPSPEDGVWAQEKKVLFQYRDGRGNLIISNIPPAARARRTARP